MRTFVALSPRQSIHGAAWEHIFVMGIRFDLILRDPISYSRWCFRSMCVPISSSSGGEKAFVVGTNHDRTVMPPGGVFDTVQGILDTSTKDSLLGRTPLVSLLWSRCCA